MMPDEQTAAPDSPCWRFNSARKYRANAAVIIEARVIEIAEHRPVVPKKSHPDGFAR
jgi:hypothetical protein